MLGVLVLSFLSLSAFWLSGCRCYISRIEVVMEQAGLEGCGEFFCFGSLRLSGGGVYAANNRIGVGAKQVGGL